MSILTKIFVVMVTILAVAFVPLVVANAFNQPNFQERIDRLQQRLRIAEDDAEEARRISNRLVQQYRTERDRERERSAEYQRRFDDAQARAQRAEDERRQVELTLAETRAQLARRSEDLSKTRDLLDEANERTRRMAEAEKGYVRQIGELNSELLQKSALAETLRRQVRHMEERFTVVQRQLADLQERIVQAPEEVQRMIRGEVEHERGFWADPPISAQVVDVSSERGTVFVQLNVGERDNVQRNMAFQLRRGDRFLGRLIIRDVDDRTSAGIVERVQDRIRQGDEAFSGRL